MTSQEAKRILLLYRPGTADRQDPDIGLAMEQARRDPELGRWFEQHQAFQIALRSKFRSLEVPENLKALARSRIAQEAVTGPVVAEVSPRVLIVPWWRSLAWLTAAAALVLLLGLSALWLRPTRPDRFINYEQMMVSTALRGYNMDFPTNDMRQLRLYFEAKGAPADYRLAPRLSKLHLLGGAALTWRGNPVAMVCFDRPDKQKVWLFVMNRAAVKDPPAAAPAESTISSLMTATWTEGDKTYVLAGPPEPGFAGKYL